MNLIVFGVFTQNSSYWRISGSIKNIFEVRKWFWRRAWKHNLSASYEISSQLSKWSHTQLLAIKMPFPAVSSLLNSTFGSAVTLLHALKSCSSLLLPPQHSVGTGSPSFGLCQGTCQLQTQATRLRRHLRTKENIFALHWQCPANSLVLELHVRAVWCNLGTAFVLLIIKDFLWTG